MRHVRLGTAGIALVLLLVLSILLAAFFCTFPWSVTAPAARAQEPQGQGPSNRERSGRGDPYPMTLIYASDDSTEARRSIDAAHARYLEAYRAGDADRLATLYAEDGALLRHGEPAVVGREAIRAHLRAELTGTRMAEGRMTTIDLFVIGSAAYATGEWQFAIAPPGKGARTRAGRFVQVWKREAVDRWMIWRDITLPS